MTPEQWAQVKDLFAEAAEVASDERLIWLESQTVDAEVMAEVRRMLAHMGSASSELLGGHVQLKAFTAAAAHAASLQAGQILAGRYQIERLIGVGGMGEVYEAEDLDLGERIAVKVMRASLVENEEAIGRFKREIQLARTVTHPNVCRIFDLQRHHDVDTGRITTFLTMELIDGEPMHRYLGRKGILKAPEVLALMRPIADALEMAHARRVIHRDFKPGNVLLARTATGMVRPVITDFGLATTFTQETETSVSIVGTPAYMAPEQFEGGNPTPATDVYAVGVLLFEMVTGKKPFASESPIALALEKIRDSSPSPLDHNPKVTPAWERVILKCLEAKPGRRYQTCGDMMEDLEAGARNRGTFAISRKRRQAIFAGLGSVAALVIFLMALWQMEYRPGEQAREWYQQGLEARYAGMEVKAVSLFEKAIQADSNFAAAYARMAESWMELDQPLRAREIMVQAEQSKPRWMRLSWKDGMILRATGEEVVGRTAPAVQLHMQIAAAAGKEDRREAAFGLARAYVWNGQAERAESVLQGLLGGKDCDGAALRQHAGLVSALRFDLARNEVHRATECFVAAGDLEGAAQARLGLAELYLRKGRRSSSESYETNDVALMNAQAAGNVELQVRMGALLSRQLADFDAMEESRAALEQAVQLALRNRMQYLAAHILVERAQHYLTEGNYFEAERHNAMARTMGEGVQARRTMARSYLLTTELMARMGLKERAVLSMRRAETLMQEVPAAGLRGEMEKVRQMVAGIVVRQEDAVLASGFSGQEEKKRR